MGIQPFTKNDRRGDLVHPLFSGGAGKVPLQHGFLRGDGGQPFILEENRQAGLFQLLTELTDLLRLEAFGSVHVQGQAGEHAGGLVLIAEGFDPAGIRPLAHPADDLQGSGHDSGRVGDRDADADIPDVEADDSFVHTQ